MKGRFEYAGIKVDPIEVYSDGANTEMSFTFSGEDADSPSWLLELTFEVDVNWRWEKGKPPAELAGPQITSIWAVLGSEPESLAMVDDRSPVAVSIRENAELLASIDEAANDYIEAFYGSLEGCTQAAEEYWDFMKEERLLPSS